VPLKPDPFRARRPRRRWWICTAPWEPTF